MVYAESVAPIPSKLQKTPEPLVPIRQQELQLKSKAETPAHCDTKVKKIEEDIKISNKKFKAGNISSCLSKWKEMGTKQMGTLKWKTLRQPCSWLEKTPI